MKHPFRIVVFLFVATSVLAGEPPTHSTPMTTATHSNEPTLGLKKYPMTPFTTVRGYVFNRGKKGRPDCHTPLNKDGTLCKSVEKPGVVLNATQQKRLLALLGTRKTFGDGETKCFIPHHGFVFYDKEDKPVAQVSICFLCAGLRASPRLPAQPKNPRYSGLGDAGMKNLRQLCADVGLPDSKE